MTHDEREAAVLADCLIRFIAKAQMSNKATLAHARRYLMDAGFGDDVSSDRMVEAAIRFLETETLATIREGT